MAGIGFFAPLPLALMIPFMAYQSLAMGEAFGQGFQYGKRRVSAMSNEDFNKMTPLKLFQIETQELKQMIPLMESSMKDMSALTPMIIKEMVKLVETFVTTAPKEILRILGLEGVLTGQTPGELEYEEWLKGDKTTPPPETDLEFPTPSPEGTPVKTPEQLREEKERTQMEINKIADQKLKEYTTLLNNLVSVNQQIKRLFDLIKTSKSNAHIQSFTVQIKQLQKKPLDSAAQALKNWKRVNSQFVRAHPTWF